MKAKRIVLYCEVILLILILGQLIVALIFPWYGQTQTATNLWKISTGFNALYLYQDCQGDPPKCYQENFFTWSHLCEAVSDATNCKTGNSEAVFGATWGVPLICIVLVSTMLVFLLLPFQHSLLVKGRSWGVISMGIICFILGATGIIVFAIFTPIAFKDDNICTADSSYLCSSFFGSQTREENGLSVKIDWQPEWGWYILLICCPQFLLTVALAAYLLWLEHKSEYADMRERPQKIPGEEDPFI